MKKFILLFNMVLLVAAMCGCACRHQWKEADCLNPQICAECGETGTEALGHSWTEADCVNPQLCSRCSVSDGSALGHDRIAATCAAPETCQRCGQTQGEQLPHNYGEWSFAEETMSHTCLSCAFEESMPLDREIQLASLVEGHWDYLFTQGADTFASSGSLSIYFGPDRSFELRGDLSKQIVGTWEFLEYIEESDGSSSYLFTLNDPEGNTLYHMLLTDDIDYSDGFLCEPQQYSLYQLASGGYVSFLKNKQLDELFAGNWCGYLGSSVYSLTFHPDRTVTGNVNGEITGTWSLSPARKTEDPMYSRVYLQYSLDGQEKSNYGTFCLSAPESVIVQGYAEEGTPAFICNNTVFLQKTDEEKVLYEDAVNKFVGTWSSLYIRVDDYSSGSTEDISATDYSVTFHSDGTYTASVGKEMTGTWEISVIRDTPGSPAYQYKMYHNNKQCAVIYLSNGSLVISEYGQANVRKNLFLEPYKEGPEEGDVP